MEEGVRHAPIDISAFSELELENRGAVDITDIAAVSPNGILKLGTRPVACLRRQRFLYAVLAKRAANILPWDTLTPAQKKVQARLMEVYAAIAERMDHHLGHVLNYLRDNGKLDNTIVSFMSDNGAAGSGAQS